MFTTQSKIIMYPFRRLYKLSVAFLLFGLFYACKPDNPLPESKFPANKVNSIYIDAQGVVWAGTDIGLINYWNGNWKSFDTLNTGEVVDIASQANKTNMQLWLATAKGAVLAEYKSGEILSTSLFTSTSSGILDNKISAVITDAINANWFATPIGLSILNTNSWYTRDEYGDLVLHPVISMAAKSDGWIFAGTTGLGVGRFKYDPSGIDGISGASYYNTEWSGLPSDTVLSIYVDKNNKQWFGTPKGVAFHAVWETKKEWKTYSVADGLVNNRVQAIAKDAAGNMWFGTANGVSYFDGLTWKNYSVADGLINQNVNDIAIDAKGAVWFATNGGISVLEGTIWRSFSK